MLGQECSDSETTRYADRAGPFGRLELSNETIKKPIGWVLLILLCCLTTLGMHKESEKHWNVQSVGFSGKHWKYKLSFGK